MDGPTNERKGDGDAATWPPPNKAYRCAYVARQVAVKAKWKLWVTQAEHDAIARASSSCPEQKAPGEAGGSSHLKLIVQSDDEHSRQRIGIHQPDPAPPPATSSRTTTSRTTSSHGQRQHRNSMQPGDPTTNSGNCYRAGEICRKATTAASGIDGNGDPIECVDNGGSGAGNTPDLSSVNFAVPASPSRLATWEILYPVAADSGCGRVLRRLRLGSARRVKGDGEDGSRGLIRITWAIFAADYVILVQPGRAPAALVRQTFA